MKTVCPKRSRCSTEYYKTVTLAILCFWGRCKDLQRQGQVNHVFCLRGVMCINLSENDSPIKLYQMNNIPEFPSESGIDNQIVNMVFFCIYYQTIHLFAVTLSFSFSRESLFSNFPAVNAPPYYSLQPQIRFTDPDFLFILPFYDRGCQMATTPKG